jgi:hypothetical protein
VLSEALATIATAVNEDITRPPQGISNISEWCKREGCWTTARPGRPYRRPAAGGLLAALASADDNRHEAKTARQTQKIDNGIEVQRQVFDVPPAQWSTILREGSSRRLLTPKEMGILQIAAQMPTKIPTERQSAILIEILGKAQQEGIV